MSARWILGIASLCLLAACEEAKPQAEPVEPPPPPPTPPILVDGSSTVYPITRAVLKLYAENITAEVKLAGSGTSAGLKKLCQREITIAGASRPIREAETKLCAEHKVEILELPVAFDGIAVVVPTANDWARDITVAELQRLWQPAAEGKVKTWRDVRPSWPDRPIELYGPGGDSGTFDYFTETVVGEARSSRKDYVASEDDDVLVGGVAEHPNALGYFGFSYYTKNRERLRALAVDDGNADNGKGAIEPSLATITEATYQPLSRPLFIYTSTQAAERKEVDDLVRFYLRAARMVAADVGGVALPDAVFEQARRRYTSRHTGSVFQGVRSVVGLTISDLLEAETAELVHVAEPTPSTP